MIFSPAPLPFPIVFIMSWFNFCGAVGQEEKQQTVLPLENNLCCLDEFASEIADRIPAVQIGAVYLQVDGKTFARLMHPHSAAESKRIGVSFSV